MNSIFAKCSVAVGLPAGTISVGRSALALLFIFAGTPWSARAALTTSGAPAVPQAHADAGPCGGMMAQLDADVPDELRQYESFANIGQAPTKLFSDFAARQGFAVTRRDADGKATEGVLRVLADNFKEKVDATGKKIYEAGEKIEVVGDFNNWGKGEKIFMTLDPATPQYMVATISNLKHGDQYRLVVNGRSLIDPAALAYANGDFNRKYYKDRNNDFLNSVFYDLGRPEAYRPKNPVTDLRGNAISLTEIELGHLANEWWYDNHAGPHEKILTYKFVAESGIIDFLKAQGINAIEFLPINASLDPDDANYRYQVFSPFAVDTRYGSPDDFRYMIDKFNEAKIAVVMDIVPGHYPFFGNRGDRSYGGIGPQNWKKHNGTSLFGDHMSPWNTYRYDYENPFVRRHLVDGVLSMIKNYHLGGLRIDNYGEILWLPGGREFLRTLIDEVRAYAPEIWINGESFGGDNYVTRRRDWNGQGANSHNNAAFFELFRVSVLSRTEDLNMEAFRSVIRNPWRWLEALNLFLLTNHDEARNGRGGATGKYLASLIRYGDNWNIVEGKTAAFASLAMMASSYYMDMLQLRFLQEGNYKDNPNVKYSLLLADSQKHMASYFADLSKYFVSHKAFAPQNQNENLENHTDYNNKVMSLERRDAQTGKRIIIVVNLGHYALSNYRFGVNVSGKLRLAIDRDSPKYGGHGWLAAGTNGGFLTVDRDGLHGKDHNLRIPYLAPYGVAVLEEE